MFKFLTAALEVFVLIFGRSVVASYLAQVRSWWVTYKDTELKKMCDGEYERLQADADALRKDRDDA